MLNWDRIDTVLLDMDGTVLDLGFDNYFWKHYLPQKLALHNQTDALSTRQALLQKFEELRGTLDWYCLDFWARELDFDLVSLKHDLVHLIGLRPGAGQFLANLQRAGKRTYLLTNAHRDSLNLKLKHVDMAGYFERMISSHDYQFPKERDEFWQHCFADIDYDPSTTLFIDDTESVLDSAKRHGIAHLLCVAKPDAKESVRTGLKYPAFDHFDELELRI